MGDITTTDGNPLYRCQKCAKRVPVLFERPSRLRVCVDCVPEKDRAVIEVDQPQEPDAESPAA